MTKSRSNKFPSEAIQVDRREWRTEVQRGQQGDPAKLLRGLSAALGSKRWEIGIANAWPLETDPTKIVLELPKPGSHQEGEKLTTEYVFDQETVWLLQAHIFNGGRVSIYISKSGKKGNTGKPNGYFYPAIWIDGFKGHIPVDRLIANAGPHRLASLVNPRDYHNHMRANIKLSTEGAVAARVGRKNVRAVRDTAREEAISASLSLWRESPMFPTLDQYEAALRQVYEVLDRRHPLGMRAPTTD